MSTKRPQVVQWRKSRRSTDTGDQCVEIALVPSDWPKSSYSDSSRAECLEVTTVSPVNEQWRKSSKSDNTDRACVEVADLAAAVAVRDSKDPGGPKLIFDPSAWQAFATQVKNGTLDLP